jgi:hypothetical protein
MSKGGVFKMSNKRVEYSHKPASFRIEKSVETEIEEIMIKRRDFNKSKLQREIFMLGFEEFKKRQGKK